MAILPHLADGVYSKHLTAHTSDPIIVETALSPETIPDGGSGANPIKETADKTLLFSPDMAININQKKPDITAAVILYGLYTWQASRGKSKNFYRPEINGNSACYRSIRELEKEYPWWADNTIWKAINRAEKAFKGEFLVQRDKDKLHYQLSGKLIKRYKFETLRQTNYDGEKDTWLRRKSRLISFKRSEATRHGVLEAVLISNLRYVIAPAHNVNPVKDETGNIYRELSPTKLTKKTVDKNGDMTAPLPVCNDTVTEGLKNLKAKKVIHEHPSRKHFYTLVEGMIEQLTDTDKVSANADKVSSDTDKVSSASAIICRNALQISDISLVALPTDGNIDINSDGKCLPTETLTLRSNVSVLGSKMSAGAIILNDLVTSHLLRHRNDLASQFSQSDFDLYKFYNVKDHDDERFIGYDLPYDFIPIDLKTGKPYSRQAEIDHIIDELMLVFKLAQFPYTKPDIDSLRQLLVNNPLLEYEHLLELLRFCSPQANPLVVGDKRAPDKGHDFYYFARRITNLKLFLRYLPQLVREYYIDGMANQWAFDYECDVATGKSIFDYADMEEPFLSIAFGGNTTTPVTYDVIVVDHKELDVDNWRYKFGKEHPEIAIKFPERYVDVYKIDSCLEEIPVYYNEFVGEPTTEVVEQERNPICAIQSCKN